MSLITCRGLGRAFGSGRARLDALVNCSLQISAGEVVGIVGANGAGKTTLLRVLAGELRPSVGEARVGGNRAGTRRARRVTGYVSDPSLIPRELTGVEWLRYLASHRTGSPGERLKLVRLALQLGGLENLAGRSIGVYSRGMVQRLALAAGAMSGSIALLLDEALSGIDPLVHRDMRDAIGRLALEGRAVLIASHDLATIERSATRALVLVGGRIVADISMAALLAVRVAELSLNGGVLSHADRMVHRYPGAVRTGDGVAIPLRRGLTVEHILAECRRERVAVGASRIRYRALEDLLVAATGGEAP